MRMNDYKQYKKSLLGFFTLDFAFCFEFLIFLYLKNIEIIPVETFNVILFIIIFPSIIALTGIILILSYDIFNQKEIHRLRNEIRLIDKIINLKKKGIIP